MQTIRLGNDKKGLFRKAIFHIHTDKATKFKQLTTPTKHERLQNIKNQTDS